MITATKDLFPFPFRTIIIAIEEEKDLSSLTSTWQGDIFVPEDTGSLPTFTTI